MAQEPYRVLARKWRPKRFEDVVGQDHITRPIQNSIRSGRIAHAFLFIGTRGVGKTTTARILAKALNCMAVPAPTPTPCGACENCRSIWEGNNIDVMEIDGASNNKVEDVREIREHVGMVPSSSRYKIYIIDEVHQLSDSAFNALLKTLEEPPQHAVFILATTEGHKVPATIISRCQRYDFRRVGLNQVKQTLRHITDAEGVRCTEEALHAIARAAEGSVRDAESILEQLISYCGEEITFQHVFDVLGLVDWRTFHELCDAIFAKDIAKQLRIIEDVVAAGKDLNQFLQDILQYFRNLLVCKTADPAELLALPEEEIEAMRVRADKLKLTELIRLIEQFADLTRDFHSQIGQRIALEALLIRISKISVDMSLDTVLEKLVLLGAGGITPSGSEARSPNPMRAAAREGDKRAAAAQDAETSTPDDLPFEEGADLRLTATPDSVGEIWTDLSHRVSKENLSLAVALGHAKPDRLEGHALVLRFAPHQDRSMEMVERPASRAAVEKMLMALTTNIRTFVCESGETLDRPDKAAVSPLPSPAGRSVREEEIKRVLENPHVACVVETFKGEIVSIRRHPGQSDSE